MPERCKQCERHERSLRDLRERRMRLWRRGELTDTVAEKLAAEQQRIAEELRAHQATQPAHSPLLVARTPKTDLHPNLEEEIRRRAYELYEIRGCEDGHDLDDWLRAEAEVTYTAPKSAMA